MTTATFGETIWCDDLKTLTVAHLGQPFVHVETGVDTRELDTALNAQPFIATKCLLTTGGGICPSDLLTLNVAYMGQPFVHLQAYGIDTLELDTAYLGQPFIAQPYYEDCEVIDPPEPEPEVDVTVRPSGGHFTYAYDDLHRYSHISKSVKRIIQKVAKEQVEENLEEVGTQESQEFINQLITALAKADLKYQAFYAEILEAERQRLIDEEIKLLMGIKRMRDEEEEVLAVLMAIP